MQEAVDEIWVHPECAEEYEVLLAVVRSAARDPLPWTRPVERLTLRNA